MCHMHILLLAWWKLQVVEALDIGNFIAGVLISSMTIFSVCVFIGWYSERRSASSDEADYEDYDDDD